MHSTHSPFLLLLLLLLLSAISCGPPPPSASSPTTLPLFTSSTHGLSFVPPGPPFRPSDTGSPRSIAHFADPATRAGIHLLAFDASGGTDATSAAERSAAYEKGLSGSVAALSDVKRRPIERFGLAGTELEYEGSSFLRGREAARMRSIDWVLYARDRVYVVKITAPSARFAELALPLLRARATLRIEPANRQP